MNVNGLTISSLITPAAYTTSTQGAAVDLLNSVNAGGRAMKAFVNVGAVTGTTPTLDLKMQESATTTAGDFTDITGATFTQLTTSGTASLVFQAKKRYVRLVATHGGTSPSFLFSASLLTEDRKE